MFQKVLNVQIEVLLIQQKLDKNALYSPIIIHENISQTNIKYNENQVILKIKEQIQSEQFLEQKKIILEYDFKD